MKSVVWMAPMSRREKYLGSWRAVELCRQCLRHPRFMSRAIFEHAENLADVRTADRHGNLTLRSDQKQATIALPPKAKHMVDVDDMAAMRAHEMRRRKLLGKGRDRALAKPFVEITVLGFEQDL